MNTTANYTMVYAGAKDWKYLVPPRLQPFSIEVIDVEYWQFKMIEYWRFSIYIGVLYLATIFTIQSAMKNRKPMKVKAVMILWNLFMASYCLFGFLRQGPELYVHLNRPNGLHRSVCVREELNQPAATWGIMFVVSKYLQLFDTVLIVLMAKPLPFLYWFHHLSAMVMTHNIFPDSEPILRWIGSCNYFVLTVMYGWFALRATGLFKLPPAAGLAVAILHVVEMIIGVVIQIYTAYVVFSGAPCDRTVNSIKWSLIPHMALCVLFTHFLYTYYKRSKKSIKETKTD